MFNVKGIMKFLYRAVVKYIGLLLLFFHLIFWATTIYSFQHLLTNQFYKFSPSRQTTCLAYCIIPPQQTGESDHNFNSVRLDFFAVKGILSIRHRNCILNASILRRAFISISLPHNTPSKQKRAKILRPQFLSETIPIYYILPRRDEKLPDCSFHHNIPIKCNLNSIVSIYLHQLLSYERSQIVRPCRWFFLSGVNLEVRFVNNSMVIGGI